MYEIRKDGALLALTEQVNYIRLHVDGFYLLCPEAEAQGVAVSGTPYHLMGRDEMPECETVVVQETDAGRVLLEEQTKAAAETRLTDQMQVAVKAYVRATTDITDAEAWLCRTCSAPGRRSWRLERPWRRTRFFGSAGSCTGWYSR